MQIIPEEVPICHGINNIMENTTFKTLKEQFFFVYYVILCFSIIRYRLASTD